MPGPGDTDFAAISPLFSLPMTHFYPDCVIDMCLSRLYLSGLGLTLLSILCNFAAILKYELLISTTNEKRISDWFDKRRYLRPSWLRFLHLIGGLIAIGPDVRHESVLFYLGCDLDCIQNNWLSALCALRYGEEINSGKDEYYYSSYLHLSVLPMLHALDMIIDDDFVYYFNKL